MDCWRNRAAQTAAVVLLMGLSVSARAADLPIEVRTAADAQKSVDIIDRYVKSQLSKLGPDTDPRTTTQARDELCRQPESPPNNAAAISSSFQTVYVTTVVQNLNPLLQSKDIAARVNAGVIVSKLAVATRSPQLESSVVALLNDPSPAVALWGVKAAGALLPSILNVPFLAGNEKLTKGVVTAATRHASTGPVVQEAYAALDVSAAKPPLPKPAVSKCVEAVLQIARARIELWTKGVPADVHAEGAAIRFITQEAIVSAVLPQQKLQIGQTVMDLLFVSTRRAGYVKVSERANIYSGISNVAGGGMYVLMRIEKDEVAANAFVPATKLPGISSPQQIETQLKSALGAALSTAAYSSLKDAPAVNPPAAE